MQCYTYSKMINDAVEQPISYYYTSHHIVTSRIDYCDSVLSSTPKKVTDKLQHVQNATARLVTWTWKYEHRLSRLTHDDLHWLVIPQRVDYKLAVTVHRCLRQRAPRYLADHCMPLSAVAGRQHLRSARCHQLSVPRVSLSIFVIRTLLSLHQESVIHCLIIWGIQLLTPNNLGEI